MKRAADHLLTLAAIVVMSAVWWLALCGLTGMPPFRFALDLWERVR